MRRLTAAALAAIALGGCGDALDEFRDDLRPLEQQAAEQRSLISSSLRGVRLGSRAEARALRTQAAELAETYDEIAKLDPPDGYEKPFGQYVKANAGAVHDLQRFASELGAGNTRGVRHASRRVVHDLGESQSARLNWLE